MIARLIKRVFGKKPAAAKKSRLQRIPFAQHGLARERILPCALKVTDTLQHGGYAAFIVGGAVRDLLLGKTAKGFRRRHQRHTGTGASAVPPFAHHRPPLSPGARDVRRGYHRSLHLPLQRACSTEEDDDRATDATGRIVRDNVFGSQEDDAERRDFTVNALYYDPTSQEIWDYRGGVADIERRRCA